MPYPRTHTFQRWEECPRCGLLWPKSSLHRDASKAKVCPECYDSESHEDAKRRVQIRVEELDTEERIEPII